MASYNFLVPRSVTALIIIQIVLYVNQCCGLLLYDSPRDLEPKNTRVLEHLASGKCLTVSEEFVLFLDDCPW